MDQTTPPPISPQTVAIQQTDTMLQNSRGFFADSQKLLDLFKERSTVHEKEINKLSLLKQEHAKLSNTLKALEEKVEEQNKSLDKLEQQINQNNTTHEAAIANLKKEYESNHTSFSFKVYTGGGIAALLFIYLWYVTHK